MISLEIAAWIILPLILFLITTSIAGVTGLVKFVRSLEHQETLQGQIAKSNQDISDKLDGFIASTNGALADHATRLALLEDFRREIRPTRR